MKTKVLAIHLPQFHTIPENDRWWGEGFTEWTNTKRGRPFYPCHYQPRVPYNNDYYDLADLKVLERQIDYAKDAKIYGFAFYHYYFTGKTLLEKPVENYRLYSKVNFPYCFIWANQSWARTWYRADAGKQILLKQTYGDKIDWKNHFDYLLDYFNDDRYIKIENKPVFVIYLPQDISCRKEMFELWYELAIDNGFEGIYLIAMKTGYGMDYLSHIYDAYMSFEPLNVMREDISVKSYLQWIKAGKLGKVNSKEYGLKNWLYAQNAFSYSYLCRQIERNKDIRTSRKTYLGAFAGWDNTSRKDEAGSIVTGSSPRRFGKHVRRMLLQSEKMRNEFLFLNAWNEWSEGAYIEPDQKYGFGYLDELKKNIGYYEEIR